MIKDRPEGLVTDPRFVRPGLPYVLDWTPVPELVRSSIEDLAGPQPITGRLARLSGGRVFGELPAVEEAYYRQRNASFQLISVVANTVHVRKQDGMSIVTPYSLSLMPASKRGEVDTAGIEYVAKASVIDNETSYFGYNPFVGEWSLYGPLSLLSATKEGFLDEIGLVVGRYYLETVYDPDDVLMLDVGMPSSKLRGKYHRRRMELVFRPFERVEARRIWGTETPIELFMVQYLALHGLHPAIQMLIMDDGATYPSWFHLWKDLEFRHAPGLVTEADLFFPDKRLAVFCDGAHHQRGKQKAKDQAIIDKLASLGIRSVRVPGWLINADIVAAGQLVLDALEANPP